MKEESTNCFVDNCQNLGIWGIAETYKLDPSVASSSNQVHGALFCTKHRPAKSVNMISEKCDQDGCDRLAYYNFAKERTTLFCRDHAEDGMINIIYLYCAHQGCPKLAYYNTEGATFALYCCEHQQSEMVRIEFQNCICEGCMKESRFNKKGEKEALYCEDHKQNDMVDVHHEACTQEGCFERAYYNIKGERDALYCKNHKQNNMVDVHCWTCIAEGCLKQANYNTKGEKRPLFCAAHQRENMFNVYKKLCIFAKGCDHYAYYGDEAGHDALYCSAHKQPGMVNVTFKKCKIDECKKHALYNEKGKPALYCSIHKQDKMVNVTNKKCDVDGCPEDARYNKKNEPALYCEMHKKDGMIDVKKGKRCLTCDRGARYGFANEPAMYCEEHKDEDMINLKQKKCAQDECPTGAYYGPVYGDALHCAKHKEPNEYKDRHPKCLGCDGCGHDILGSVCKEPPTCTNAPRENYPLYCSTHAPQDGSARTLDFTICNKCKIDAIVSATSMLCATCEFGAVFGNMHNVKEERMASVLKKHNLIPTTHNQPIGESKRRPDFYFNCRTFAIILEVDENQHARNYANLKKSTCTDSEPINSYSCECEFTRMVDLHGDINLPRTLTNQPSIPTIFVRYNPDKYIDAHEVRQIASRGCVRDRNVANFVRWLINYHTTHALPEGLYAVYLYYNGFDEQQDDAYNDHAYRIDYMNNALSHWDIFNKEEQTKEKKEKQPQE